MVLRTLPKCMPDGCCCGLLQTVNTCEVCGEVAHEGCARHVPHDCKPVALDAPDMVHLWRPAGVAMSAQDVRHPPRPLKPLVELQGQLRHEFHCGQQPPLLARLLLCLARQPVQPFDAPATVLPDRTSAPACKPARAHEAHACCGANSLGFGQLQEDGEAAVQVCHYCRQLCEPDMFSSEPIWSCAWCQVMLAVHPW